MKYTVLIAEDDNDIVEILKLYLESSGYNVLTADNGLSAFTLLTNEQVDIAILDIMMPKMDGYELIKKIRSKKDIPILVLSAKDQYQDKILGLNLGADDYIAKPFNPLEVIARIQAILRRFYKSRNSENNTNKEKKIIIDNLTLDTEELTLYKDDKEIIITPNEYKILALLMKTPGKVYTKSRICEAINGEFYENYENTIAVHISRIREKIGDNPRSPRYIKNVRGIGYKIEK